jgi:hypothetical protein
LIIAPLASPIFGKIYDDIQNAKKLLIIAGSVGSLGISMISVGVLYVILI